MNSDTSFSQKQKAGWTRDKLMKHYAMTDREFDRVLACLADIQARGAA